MIRDFDHLTETVGKRPEKKRILVVSAHDRETLEGVCLACGSGVVEPILLGREELILKIIAENGIDLPRPKIIHCPDDEEAARIAVGMIRRGEGDVLMKGGCRTADLLRQVVHRETGLGKGGLMSHIGVFQLPGFHKLIAITDGGMIPHPTLEEKGKLISNATSFMQSLGYELPKVACLAAGEDVNPKAPETVDGARLKEMNRRGEITGCIVEGPISYDLAMSRQAAEQKCYESPVAGDADILLVPDMAAGNILAKSWTISGGGIMSGVVVGAMAPIVLVSRGASPREKFLSIVLAAATAH